MKWWGDRRISGETTIKTRCYVKVLYSFRRSFIADIGVGNAALILLFFSPYMCTYMYKYTYTCVCTYVSISVHIHIYIHNIYIYIHVRTYVCVYTYIYTLISDPNYSSKLPSDIKKYACICTCTITTHARTAGILVQ